MRGNDGLVRGVFERAPGAPRTGFEQRCDLRNRVARLLSCEQSGASAQNVAVIVGQSLVHPQQIVLHWHVKVWGPKVGRTAKFAVPGMGVLVGQKSTARDSGCPIRKVVGAGTVFAR